MSDMTAVITPKSDQINADDLISGPMTIRIASVLVQGGTEQPVSMAFEGSAKVFRPCKSMSRVIVAAWGPDSKAYTGRSMTLYRDASVKWGGMAVGGIRISHLSHIDKDMTMMLTMTKQNRAPHKVQVLRVSDPAMPTRDEAAEDAALAAADQGKAAFGAWWNSDYGKTRRDAVNGVMDECKRRVLVWEDGNAVQLDEDQPPM
jgi:hypothetical protein